MTSRYLALASIVLAACGARAPIATPPAPAPATASTPAPEQAPDTGRGFSKLSKGWNRIHGPDGTGCAKDSNDFVFHVRPGLTDKVLVYLNGGGVCWRAAECDPRSRSYLDDADIGNDVAVRAGLFDVANPKNPVAGYTMIFVPACTGDAHLGARTADYEAKGGKRTFTVRHLGSANMDAVLAWLYANMRNPRTLFVAGSGSGAIATPVYAQKLARHYPRARVSALGDGAGALRGPGFPAMLASWNATDYLQRDAAYRTLDSADFTLDRLYLASGRAAARVHYAQFNYSEDPAQASLAAMLGNAQPVSRLLGDNLLPLREDMPWFHSYVAPGRVTGVLRSAALYTVAVNGTPLRDWIESLANGEELEDVGLGAKSKSEIAKVKKDAKAAASAKKPATSKGAKTSTTKPKGGTKP